MSASPDLRPTVITKLDAALTQRGVLQELLLLRLLNSVIAQFAATATDWRMTSALEARQWREQLGELLNQLRFMVASADCYAAEPTQLAAEVAQLGTQLATSERQLADLRADHAALLTALGRTQVEVVAVQREVDALETLKNLLPLHVELTTRLGTQRMQALADGMLAQETTRQREHAQQLALEIDTRLLDLETLLNQNFHLEERDWQALCAAVTATTGH